LLFTLLQRGLAALPLDWLLARPCPLCRCLPPPGAATDGPCPSCWRELDLPAEGLSGNWPLPWWSSASYGGALRRRLLSQRRRPDPAVVMALLQPLERALAPLDLALAGSSGARAVLVPIPSWKRQANPLPGLIAEGLVRRLGLRRLDLLERSRVVLGQHRLGRRLRLANQRDSFRCRPAAAGQRQRPVLIVDDILTTGATAHSAALCLEAAGWPVLGLVCLARTPARGQKAVI
jgi:predicted amidophosphoribosyltransferase